MSSTDYPGDYFPATRFMHKWGGLHIPDKTKKYRKWLFFMCYNSFCIFICQIVFFPSEVSKLTDTVKDLQNLIDHIGMMLTHVIGNVKLISFYWRRKDFVKLLTILEDGEFRYENCGSFHPGVYFQQAKRTVDIVTYVFFSIAIAVPQSYYAAVLYNYQFKFTPEDFLNKNITCDELLPYYSWIPFPMNTKPRCGVALIYQSIPMTLYAFEIVAFEVTFTAMLAFAKAHLFSLRGAFATTRSRSLQKLELPADYFIYTDDDNPKLDHEMNQQMKKCSRHLQTILDVVDQMESIFTYITLAQVLVTLFVLVTCLFMLSTVPLLSSAFLAAVVYLTALMYQIGLVCWFGNEITLTSADLSDAMYEADWLSSTYRYKTSMLINMIRMQRPVTLTVGKFSPLTLTTLVSIVRGSYSYFAVLKNRDAS